VGVGLLAVAAAVVFLTADYFRGAQRDYLAVQREVGAFRQTSQAMEEGYRQAVAEWTEQARSMSNHVVRQETVLAGLGSSMGARLGGVDSELTRMRELVAALSSNNVSLKRDLETVRKELPTLADQVDSTLTEIARLRGGLPRKEAARPSGTLSILITPPNAKEPVSWRLPIPE
jgi:hypothetical protein